MLDGMDLKIDSFLKKYILQVFAGILRTEKKQNKMLKMKIKV